MFVGNEIDNELQKREQLIREFERKQSRKRFNIIGFNTEPSYSNWTPKRHCAYHPGTRLIQGWDEKGGYVPGVLQCPQCGKRYTSESPAPTEEGLKSKHGQTKPRIITAKTKKREKHYDSLGNEINQDDKDIMNLIAQGYQIKYYHEAKPLKKKENEA